jgi:Tfp pilus assembly protein PilX
MCLCLEPLVIKIEDKMVKKNKQNGFIPLIIMLILVIVAVIAVAFLRVYKAQG